MDRRYSEGIVTPVMVNSSTTSLAKNKTVQENFKLTFYPDQASVEDREKMQKIWNQIESESKFEKLDVDVFTSNKRNVNEKSIKNDSKVGKEVVADNFKDEDKQINETGMNYEQKTPEISPGSALELLNHFRELHITEACLKKTEGYASQSKYFKRSTADNVQMNLNDIENQIKHYEKDLATKVIENKRALKVHSNSTEDLK